MKQELEGTPNAVLIARYCKLFGLSPAEEVKKGSLNMAINWACYIAYVQAENEEYEKAQGKSENEAVALSKYIEDMKQQATGRG